MAQKTLSPGTLNLRFMRDARRPQHTPLPPVHNPVHDDAEWVLPHPAYPSEKPCVPPARLPSVTYDTSYLPFLFPSLHDTPAADGPSSLSPQDTLRPRGRRVFNSRGHEITLQVRGPLTS